MDPLIHKMANHVWDFTCGAITKGIVVRDGCITSRRLTKRATITSKEGFLLFYKIPVRSMIFCDHATTSVTFARAAAILVRKGHPTPWEVHDHRDFEDVDVRSCDRQPAGWYDRPRVQRWKDLVSKDGKIVSKDGKIVSKDGKIDLVSDYFNVFIFFVVEGG